MREMAAKNLLNVPANHVEKSEENTVHMFLGETVLAEASVKRVNHMAERKTGAMGNLLVTNFKVTFTCSKNQNNPSDTKVTCLSSLDHILSEECFDVDDVIPLTVIQRVFVISTNKQKRKEIKNANKEIALHYDLIEIETKDFRILQYDFQNATPQNKKSTIQMISHYAFPTARSRLFAFDYGKNAWKSSTETTERAFCTYCNIKDYELDINRLRSCEHWRVSRVNEKFNICKSLPEYNICPMGLEDSKLIDLASKYIDSRFPVWLWSDPLTGAALLTSSKLRNDTDLTLHEHPVILTDSISACQTKLGSGKTVSIEVGSPCPTIKQLKNNYEKLHELCSTRSSKDFWDSESGWLKVLEDTGYKHFLKLLSFPYLYSWLSNASSFLELSLNITKIISEQNTSVIVSDLDGRNFSLLVTSLVQILLDPYYRTLIGFQALIQKDWVLKGHPFSKRLGHLTKHDQKLGYKDKKTSSLKRKNDYGDKDILYDGDSPIFLLFLECVHQILRQFPLKFEYTEQFLILLVDSSYSSLFGTFLYDSQYDQQQDLEDEKSQLVSVWDFIATNIPQSKYVSVFTNASFKIDQMNIDLMLGQTDNSSCSSHSNTSQDSMASHCNDAILDLKTRPTLLRLWNAFLFRWFPCTDLNKGSSREIVLQRQQIQFMDELLYLKDRMLQLNMQLMTSMQAMTSIQCLSSVQTDSLTMNNMISATSSCRRKRKHKRNASRFSNNEEVQNDFLQIMTGFHFLKML